MFWSLWLSGRFVGVAVSCGGWRVRPKKGWGAFLLAFPAAARRNTQYHKKKKKQPLGGRKKRRSGCGAGLCRCARAGALCVGDPFPPHISPHWVAAAVRALRARLLRPAPPPPRRCRGLAAAVMLSGSFLAFRVVIYFCRAFTMVAIRRSMRVWGLGLAIGLLTRPDTL